MKPSKGIWKASKVFAPGYPRHSSSCNTMQAIRYDRSDFCRALESALDTEMPGYYSVYSFPRGHSRDGNIPKVDCIFIDLDVAGGDYKPNEDETSFEAWVRDMSALLARARMVANAIIESNQEDHFRAVLSGHKGLHLYLDFDTISANNGDFQQFKAGLKSYGEEVMSWLDNIGGGLNIQKWVDVDASDLGRLARHPNTIHHGAKYDDKTRWCVPITISELCDIEVDDYLSLTEEPRWPDGYARHNSKAAGKKVVQSIRNADTSVHNQSVNQTTFNVEKVEEYANQSNEDIELEDIAFLTSNKPCIEAFRKQEDAFEHGSASHKMELNIIAHFVELSVPRTVIHEFFEQIPGYREGYTDEQIDKIIGRKYGQFNCNSIADHASRFCLGSDCSVYNRNDDIQK